MPLNVLNWRSVRGHYDDRIKVQKELKRLCGLGPSKDFVELALGISDPTGNYSAAEHALGPQILSDNLNATNRIHELASQFSFLKDGLGVPILISEAGLQRLKIGVGSELSCMMNPTVCWVANTRTIWTHLVFKHRGDIEKANEELILYRDKDDSSEMAYKRWTALHKEVVSTLSDISRLGSLLAKRSNVKAGNVPFLWADAVCSALYSHHHE